MKLYWNVCALFESVCFIFYLILNQGTQKVFWLFYWRSLQNIYIFVTLSSVFILLTNSMGFYGGVVSLKYQAAVTRGGSSGSSDCARAWLMIIISIPLPPQEPGRILAESLPAQKAQAIRSFVLANSSFALCCDNRLVNDWLRGRNDHFKVFA